MTIDPREQKVLDVLTNLDISFRRYEHPPVYTVEQAKQHWDAIPGVHCKNLFLRNKKGTCHYLLIMEQSKKAELKTLAQRLGEERLSFASDERLMRYLGLEAGAVSPFGLINDHRREVLVLIDEDVLGADMIYFHPNVNTATIGLSFADFEKFLTYSGQNIKHLCI